MKLLLLSLFSLFFSANFLNIYVAPPSSNNCTQKAQTSSNLCVGSQENPFDDLSSAFVEGVSTAKQVNDLTLNFYLYPTEMSQGHTIEAGYGSPFEDYYG